MKMAYCFKKSLAITLVIIITLSMVTSVEAINSDETVIIAPENLEGISGAAIKTDDIFVQKITLYEVTNIEDIEIVDDNGNIIKLFPREEYKATVRRTSTKETLGFINLIPVELDGVVPTNSNLGGEFLFYQDGRIFNKIGLANEGKIYFYKQGKTSQDRPMILDIGTVKDGSFTYKDYVTVTGSTISLRRD